MEGDEEQPSSICSRVPQDSPLLADPCAGGRRTPSGLDIRVFTKNCQRLLEGKVAERSSRRSWRGPDVSTRLSNRLGLDLMRERLSPAEVR
jgi:hypothetical protein